MHTSLKLVHCGREKRKIQESFKSLPINFNAILKRIQCNGSQWQANCFIWGSCTIWHPVQVGLQDTREQQGYSSTSSKGTFQFPCQKCPIMMMIQYFWCPLKRNIYRILLTFPVHDPGFEPLSFLSQAGCGTTVCTELHGQQQEGSKVEGQQRAGGDTLPIKEL